MTVDMQVLVWVAVLSVLLAFPYTLALIAKVGLVRTASYPQPVDVELAPWAQRSRRAHMNFVENIAPFAILVLAAQVMGLANETTALGATIFFWARVVQALGHTLGIPFLRTVSWFTSLAGLVVILAQIL